MVEKFVTMEQEHAFAIDIAEITQRINDFRFRFKNLNIAIISNIAIFSGRYFDIEKMDIEQA